MQSDIRGSVSQEFVSSNTKLLRAAAAGAAGRDQQDGFEAALGNSGTLSQIR